MNGNVQIVSKGLYNGTVDIGSPICVKEYVFVREKGKKCLILRFLNESDIVVNSFNFKLVQKNSDGDVITESKIAVNCIAWRAGEIFTPNDCFFVNDKCVDFDVKVISVLSNCYEYKTEGGESYVRYPIQGDNASRRAKKGDIIQRSKMDRKVKFTAAILVLALLLICFALIWPFYNEEIRPVIENSIKTAWKIFVKLVDRAIVLIERLFDMIGEYFSGRKAV